MYHDVFVKIIPNTTSDRNSIDILILHFLLKTALTSENQATKVY